MLLWLEAMIANVEQVVTAAISAAAAVYVAAVWWRTKALVPTITAIVVAGVVVWASANVDFISDRVAEDAGNVQVDAPAGD